MNLSPSGKIRRKFTTVKKDDSKIFIFDKHQATDDLVSELSRSLKNQTKDLEHLYIRENHFNDEKATILANALANNSTLKSLHIEDCNFIGNSLSYLLLQLSSHVSLESLTLQKIPVTPHIVSSLCHLLSSTSTLISLTLQSNWIDDQQLTLISKSIGQNMTLKNLSIGNNPVTKKGMKPLFEALKEATQLNNIEIQSIKFGQKETLLMFEYLRDERCKVEELKIEDIGIKDNDLDVLLIALREVQSLTKISFSKKPLNVVSAKLLSELPRLLKNLRVVQMHHAEIDETTVPYICRNIIVQDNLKIMDLSYNNLNFLSANSLAQLIKESSIEELILTHNFLGPQGAIIIASALETDRFLRVLDLSSNNIGDEGFKGFRNVFMHNESLVQLKLRQNGINNQSNEIRETLDCIEKLKSKIRFIDLRGNMIDNVGAQQILEYVKTNISLRDIELEDNNITDKRIKSQIAIELEMNQMIENVFTQQQPTIFQSLLEKQISEEENIEDGFGQFIDDQKAKIGKEPEPEIIKKNEGQISIKLGHCSLRRCDFLAKYLFICKDKVDLLELKNIKFGCSLDLFFQFLSANKTTLQSLIILDCDLSLTNFKDLICGIQNQSALKELSLININLDFDSNLSNLSKNHSLITLDLRNNKIKYPFELIKLIGSSSSLQTINYQGNVFRQKDYQELAQAIKKNLSLFQLEIDERSFYLVNQIDITPTPRPQLYRQSTTPKFNRQTSSLEANFVKEVKRELILNQEIQQIIISRIKEQRSRVSSKLDLKGCKIKHIEALIKYLQCNGFKSKLDLSDNGIGDNELKKLVEFSLESNYFMKKLILRNNKITEMGVYQLSKILNREGTILKLLDLTGNPLGIYSIKNLINDLKNNTILEKLYLNNCNLDLQLIGSSMNISQSIINDMKCNCSLYVLELDGNTIDEKILKQIRDELDQNKAISDNILPYFHEILKNEAQQMLNQDSDSDKSHLSAFDSQDGDSSPIRIKNSGKTPKISYNDAITQNKSNYDKNLQKMISQRMIDNEKPIIQKGGKSNRGQYYEIPSSTVQSEPFDNTAPLETQIALHPKAKTQTQEQLMKNILSLKGKGLKSLDFLSKFVKNHPYFTEIHIDTNSLPQNEMMKFAETLKQNLVVQNVFFKGNKLNAATRSIMQKELHKNRDIVSLLPQINTNPSRSVLNLSKKQIKNINFLTKLIQDYRKLHVLDLSDNNIGDNGAAEIRQLIEQNQTIRSINLSNTNLSAAGLQQICSALCINKSIQEIDITNNNIPDYSLKMLMTLLFRNMTIVSIKFTVKEEKNIHREEQFQKLTHLPADSLIEIFNKVEKKKLKWWEKVIFPICCWKSCMHDKHEAFRFKYDTEALNFIEEELMDRTTLILYINAVIFYFLCFGLPYIFAEQCGGGISMTSHLIFGGYQFLSLLLEVYLVLRIQRNIEDKNILRFNKWHWVELIMGQIARFDLYTDICFSVLLFECSMWNLLIPVTIFLVLMLIYPFFMIIKLTKTNHLLNHTHPRIERNCKLSFIRENMLLATVLDSFSITNFETICRKPIVFAKIMGTMTFFLQDLPQITIHLYFLLGIHSPIPHSEVTVELSLIISIFATSVSLFNFIVSKPNEFDPVLLQIELKRRLERKSNPSRKKRFSKLLTKGVDANISPQIKKRQTANFFSILNSQKLSSPVSIANAVSDPANHIPPSTTTSNKLRLTSSSLKKRQSIQGTLGAINKTINDMNEIKEKNQSYMLKRLKTETLSRKKDPSFIESSNFQPSELIFKGQQAKYSPQQQWSTQKKEEFKESIMEDESFKVISNKNRKSTRRPALILSKHNFKSERFD